MLLADAESARSAIYNLGTGTGSGSLFVDLVTSTFSALNLRPNIRFIDMPEDIPRKKYQYFTEGNMRNCRMPAIPHPFIHLKKKVKELRSKLLEKKH